MREAVFAFQPQQQELPEGLEEEDDDDDDSDSDEDGDEDGDGDGKAAPVPANGRVAIQILKGPLGYGMDIGDDGKVVGFAAMERNPAQEAGVPVPSQVVSVNGVEVCTTPLLRLCCRDLNAEIPGQRRERSVLACVGLCMQIKPANRCDLI